MSSYKVIFLFICTVFCQQSAAIGNEELVPVDQAFQLSIRALNAQQVELNWDIREGYYLYRDKLKFSSQTDQISLGDPQIPQGYQKHDEFFGDVEIYRQQLHVLLPINRSLQQNELQLSVKYQGCADIGVCYPPQTKVLTVALPNSGDELTKDIGSFFKGLGNAALNLFEDELLPAEQAFLFFAEVKDPQTIRVSWDIADKYYLYRDKIHINLIGQTETQLGAYQIPQGEPYKDEEFGNVEIFHHALAFEIPLRRLTKTAQMIQLEAKYQGCAERGVCYPPMATRVELWLPEALTVASKTDDTALLSEQDQIINSLRHDALWLTLLSFFGFGLLLAFTPCVFPMVPILSGIIIGNSQVIDTRKAFLLSLSYVMAAALTYTVFGILAALFGSNLQAVFQQPWIIASFSAIFVILSLSMFGFYHLELPKSLQNWLHNSSEKHRDGSYIGAFIMGGLSALIVGPCVAAPLAAALIYIGQTGDVLLGGSALFSMGLGMGVPLLLLGASAGKLLPKAGHWLNSTKAVFGVLMLAVAVWMLDRILPPEITMLLWAMLLIIPAIYLKAVDPLPVDANNWQKLWKGLGMILLIYGVMLLIGSGSGSHNPLQPLQGLAVSQAGQRAPELEFQRVKTVADLTEHIERASVNQRKVMLDFYADWCVSCKEMEAYTFSDPSVQRHLADFVLLQADVTANDLHDQALLRRFDLIGPPGIIFFDNNRQEIAHARVIGYQDAEKFTQILQRL